MPDLPKILLLNMDCLFFPVLFSNSMPKILYPKPTTNLSQISQIVDGGILYNTVRQLLLTVSNDKLKNAIN